MTAILSRLDAIEQHQHRLHDGCQSATLGRDPAVLIELPVDGTGYLTPDHVAELLGSNRITVMKLMDLGRLRFVNIGTGRRTFRRTTRAWVREFVASTGAAATAGQRAA